MEEIKNNIYQELIIREILAPYVAWLENPTLQVVWVINDNLSLISSKQILSHCSENNLEPYFIFKKWWGRAKKKIIVHQTSHKLSTF